jgi:hypothetical protein
MGIELCTLLFSYFELKLKLSTRPTSGLGLGFQHVLNQFELRKYKKWSQYVLVAICGSSLFFRNGVLKFEICIIAMSII